MCSDDGNDRVLDIVKNDGYVTSGCNVQIYSPVDAEAQEWQFAYDGEGKFRIFPTSNVYALLTANGDGNGTANGTSSSSTGNVYLSELPMSSFAAPTDYQLWYIEEVSPKRTIADGFYKIKNGYGYYLETNLNNNSVYQMTKQNHLSQIWEICYTFGGYYVIRTAANLDRTLSVESNYDELGSAIHTYLPEGQKLTELKKWTQWKIVPNISGGYRIVSKSSYDNQVVTILYDDTPLTPVGQVPYTDAPSQQWWFSKAQCPKKGITEHADGHLFYLDTGSSVLRYRCHLCTAVFKTPQEQDYENNHLSLEDRAIIFALQRAAVLKQIEGGKDHFVEAYLRAADIIRSEQNGHFVYDFSHSDGSYMSPYEYKYNSLSIDASIDISASTYGTMRQITNKLTWTIGNALPLPFNVISEIMESAVSIDKPYIYAELVKIFLDEYYGRKPTRRHIPFYCIYFTLKFID